VVELIFVGVIASAVWVFIDAPARGLSWTWGLGVLAVWIVAFPWYLVERNRQPVIGRAGSSPTNPAVSQAAVPETDLQRLQRMRAEGQLTEAQYEGQKRQLNRRR
jgi:4-amino-4-deoxy-L-arabinose transferase-like glycosyltransferase